jgi:hypothetical protein
MTHYARDDQLSAPPIIDARAKFKLADSKGCSCTMNASESRQMRTFAPRMAMYKYTEQATI